MPAEIVPGLYQLPGVTLVGSYLWRPRSQAETTGLPILFDCGWPWSGRGLTASLIALGCYPEDLRTIVVTHDDVDHVGRLAALSTASGASVVAHEIEARQLAADHWRRPPLFAGPVQLLAGLLDRVYQQNWRHASVRVTQSVIDGSQLPGGWLAVHTPGHTRGHTSYFYPERSLLIAGDALGHHSSGLVFPMPIYTEDAGAAANSIRKLAALEPQVIVFGHGPALHNAARVLAAFARSEAVTSRLGR